MPQEKGSLTGYNLYEESVYGTFPTAGNAVRIPIVSDDLRLTQDFVESAALVANRNAQMPVLNEKTVSGGFEYQPDIRSIGYILKHLLGAVSTTVDTPSTGLNTHEFTVGSLPTGISIEKWLPSLPAAIRFSGIKIDSMSFDVTPGGLLTARVDVQGMDEDNTPVAQEDAAPVQFAVRPFRMPIVTLSEGGAPMTIASAFSVTLANNLEAIRTIGNQGRIADLNEGIFRATGTMSVLFRDMTTYNKAKDQTETSMILTFPATDPTNGMSLQFEFDEVLYSVASPTIQGPGGMIVEMSWQAFVAAGDTTARVTLVNDVASYASVPATA